MTQTVPQNRHLNEAPAGAFILGALTVTTERNFKALATTLQRGTDLLSEGYAFVRANAGVYIVATPKGDIYNIAYDEARSVASCTCEACVRLGTCKHVVCLFLNKAEIDAENDKREERDRQYTAPKATAKMSYWDGWNAFLDQIEQNQ